MVQVAFMSSPGKRCPVALRGRESALGRDDIGFVILHNYLMQWIIKVDPV
jgi:hypothetical protein